jgi:hypothetical protein
MEIISAAGWLLRKVADTVASTILGKAAQTALEKVGVFNARCEKCHTTQSNVIIPEDKPFTLECPKCGHIGTILVENVDRVIIHQIKNAGIVIDTANVLIKQANTISNPGFSSLPEPGATGSIGEKKPYSSLLSINEYEASGGIIVDRKIIESTISESINRVNYIYGGLIKQFLVVDIKATVTTSDGSSMLVPEIWVVPDSRRNMGRINDFIQAYIRESLNEIGFTLEKIIIRFYEKDLPNR